MKLNELMKKLKQDESVPAGWRTNINWSKYWGISIPHARALLAQAVSNNLCAVKNFRVKGARGTLRPTPHYKFKEVA